MSVVLNAAIDRAHTWVVEAYLAVKRVAPTFEARAAQVQLSKDVARSLLTGDPLVAEAPTGTGKTLAYLIGALAVDHAEKARPTQNNTPAVVTTATKLLQQQLIDNDLPLLVKAGLLKSSEFLLVKGKSNYFCLKQALDIEATLEQSGSNPDLFLGENTETLDVEQLGALIQAFTDSYWNGDFDAFEGRLPGKSLKAIAVSSETCTQRKCAHFADCAFYKARAAQADKKLLVANHALVMIDLLAAYQEREPILSPSNYRLIVDEAHHLPEKAIDVGTADFKVSLLAYSLSKLSGVQRLLNEHEDLQACVSKLGVMPGDFDRAALNGPMKFLLEQLESYPLEDGDNVFYRFKGGDVPTDLQNLLAGIETPLKAISGATDNSVVALRDAKPRDANRALYFAELQRRLLDLKSILSPAVENMGRFLAGRCAAKWLQNKDGELSLHSAPLEGAIVLRPVLWKSDRVTATAMLSATLRDLGRFNRFSVKAGLPPNTQFTTLPYTFPYEKSELIVADMSATPKPAERKAFISELSVKLPRDINPNEGTLVLFPSWGMLQELGPLLQSRFGYDAVHLQGDRPIRGLVKEHCARIERGLPSILAGVASMSEGLDLPGILCEHVVIVSLPFAVPTSPVEQELAEQLGERYFRERSLPDAMIKLVQMIGRLIRRESDVGKITIYDKRLGSTQYGRQMLNNLPPFRKIIQKV